MSKRRLVPALAVFAMSASLVVPTAPAMADQSDRAALDEAIAVSLDAYGSVVSRHQTGKSADDGSAVEVLESGVYGVVGSSMQSADFDLAWSEVTRQRDWVVKVPSRNLVEATGEGGYRVYASLSDTVVTWPPRVRRIVTDDVVSRGGTAESMVPQYELAPDPDQSNSSVGYFNLMANPAVLMSVYFDLFPEAQVTSTALEDGRVLYELSMGPSDPQRLEVTVNAAGLITLVSSEENKANLGVIVETMEVLSYGEDVVVPDFVAERVNTPLSLYANTYVTSKSYVMSTLAAAARTANSKAAMSKSGKVTRSSIREALEDIGVFSNPDLYNPRRIANGFAVSYVMSKQVRDAFGPACGQIVVAKGKARVQDCT